MKRRELVRQLAEVGCVLIRHGGRHDIYLNPVNGKKQPSRAIPKWKNILLGIYAECLAF